MNNSCSANKHIECSIKNCKYHCGNDNYCSLDRIMIGSTQPNPTMCQYTDCESFESIT